MESLGSLKLGKVIAKMAANFFLKGICKEFYLIAGLNMITPLSYLLVNRFARQKATAPPRLFPIKYTLVLGYCFLM